MANYLSGYNLQHITLRKATSIRSAFWVAVVVVALLQLEAIFLGAANSFCFLNTDLQKEKQKKKKNQEGSKAERNGSRASEDGGHRDSTAKLGGEGVRSHLKRAKQNWCFFSPPFFLFAFSFLLSQGVQGLLFGV